MKREINFGLIGCGRIAKNHLEAIAAMPEMSLVAVCDNDADALRRATKQYNCSGYDNYTDMLKDPVIDVVNICTPSGLHARMAIDAMTAGKHVLVEKPMAMSLAEADAMIATAEKCGVQLGVVHQNRFNRAVVKLRSALDQGRFGRLTHGSAVVRWSRDENYYRQAPWRGTWAQDGGCLMNQSIHNIDLLQWMLGPVVSVFAHTARNVQKIEAEDVAVAVLKFANGALATIEASSTIYPKNFEETLSVFGVNGTVVIGGVAVNKIEAWRLAGEDEQAVLSEQFKEPPNVYGFGHVSIITDFVEALKTGRKPAVPGPEGRKAVELVLAIYHSARLGREVILPLAEQFQIGIGL